MIVTNTSITFERTMRPADYESKKASVTLSAASGLDGESLTPEQIAQLGDMARDEALRLVSEAPAKVEYIHVGGTMPPNPHPSAQVVSPTTSTATNEAVHGSLPSNADLQAAAREAVDTRKVPAGMVTAEVNKFVDQPGMKMNSLPADSPKRAQLLAHLKALKPEQAATLPPAY